MKQKLMTMAAVMCCTMISTVFTACGKTDKMTTLEDPKNLQINLDSIVIEPYMEFGTSLAEVERYMRVIHDDYNLEDPGALERYEEEGGTTYGRSYEKGNRQIRFSFDDAAGSCLTHTSYDYFFPVDLKPIMTELERHGFENKGVAKFDDNNADICYLFLSEDEETEILLSSWEKNGGSWSISFLPTNPSDLNHIVRHREVILFINNIKKTILL
jgi:hypothetical protein